MNNSQFVSAIKTPELTEADLALNKWRPIPFDKFVATLTDAAFYDSEYYIAPVSINFDLENNTNAIVWCTCCEIEHDIEDMAIMSPELLVLSSFDDSDQRRYLCFIRN